MNVRSLGAATNLVMAVSVKRGEHFPQSYVGDAKIDTVNAMAAFSAALYAGI
jgi:hypothetical protein